MAGVLGCPICRAEYPIVDGVAHFDDACGAARTPAVAADEAEAMRLAAFLDLSDPRGFAVLVGSLGAHARLVQRLTAVHLLLVDPPREIEMGQGISGLTAGGALPLAHGSARGVALDERATPALLLAASLVVRPGGRLVAPISHEVPPGITELVRDERVWIGAREPSSVSAPIGLRRA